MREREREKKNPYTFGGNAIWIKIIYFTELSEGEKEENNISTSPLEDYNLFSRLSDNLYSSNTNNAASDKRGGGGGHTVPPPRTWISTPEVGACGNNLWR